MATSDWLTASEAAQYLKVKDHTVLLWARQGKLKYKLSGTKRHAWRFLKADLDATLFEQEHVLNSPAPSVPCGKGAQ
jgi:excisionase family DNA binding protein